MGRRLTDQLLGLGRNIISITADMPTSHCVMGRHAKRMQLRFNDFCCRCRSAEKEETIINFLCQFLSLARLIVSLILVTLTELSAIDVKDIASFVKLGWFSSMRWLCFKCATLALATFFLPDLEKLGQDRNCVHLWHHNGPLWVLMWAFDLMLPHWPNLT